MEVIYAVSDPPSRIGSSLFLAGPTPRSDDVPSWRGEALRVLRDFGYRGVVFVPESASGKRRADYLDQIAWEQYCRRIADVVVIWVPRELQTLPGFTTNVEFGLDLGTGKVRYGRPAHAPHTSYLDSQFESTHGQRPVESLSELLQGVIAELGDGSIRQAGERDIPLPIWNSQPFQQWYRALRQAGNRLEGARVIWTFAAPEPSSWGCFGLHVQVWVENEQRVKVNELVFFRPDLSCVVAYRHTGDDPLAAELVLVQEFRSTGRTSEGWIRELPGGSSNDPWLAARDVAAKEFREETGLNVCVERLRSIGTRQAAGSVATHHVNAFAVELAADEMLVAKKRAASGEALGDTETSERTYVRVQTLREVLGARSSDWATLGIVMAAILGSMDGPCREHTHS